MFTISHQQAQRLIRQSLDRPLDNEGWAALQAHLESCPECRAYRARQSALEKDVRRRLGHRWSPVPGPLMVAESVVDTFRRRKLRVKQARRGAKIAGALTAVLIIVWVFTILNPPPSPERVSGSAPVPTPSLNPAVPTFRGSVVYADAPKQGAPHDLYLLTGGPKGVEKVPLTGPAAAQESADGQNTAASDNLYPIWSPDGAWIAFLSNRADPAGKRYDVYAMSIAGTRITRLTNDPSVSYQGPITWSGDGRWIAGLVASTNSTVQGQWISLIPIPAADQPGVSGTINIPSKDTGARPLSRSHGAAALRFSPTGDRLAFLQDNQLKVFNVDQGIIITLVMSDTMQLAPDFDWSPNGLGIAYAYTTPVVQLNATGPLDFSASAGANGAEPKGSLLVSDKEGRVFPAAVWLPGPAASTALGVKPGAAAGTIVPDHSAEGVAANSWVGLISTPTATATATAIPAPAFSGAGVLFTRQSGSDPCAALQEMQFTSVVRPDQPSWSPTWMPRFCVYQQPGSALAHENWSPAGDWLVAAGSIQAMSASNQPVGMVQFPDGSGFGIYGLRIPPNGDPSQPDPADNNGKIELLAAAENLAGQPRFRPAGKDLNLAPREASQPDPLGAFEPQLSSQPQVTVPGAQPGGTLITPTPAPGTAVQLPSRLRGQIIGLAARNQDIAALWSADGPNAQARLQSGGLVPRDLYAPYQGEKLTCPALSPEGQRVAFTVNGPGDQTEVDVIHLTPGADPAPRPVATKATLANPPKGPWTYGCPAWSPDGQWIAVVGQSDSQANLLLLHAQLDAQGAPAQAMTISLYPHLVTTPPRWLPDGRTLLLGTGVTPLEMAEILAVNTATGQVSSWLPSDGFDVVTDLAVSPDGAEVAFLTQTANLTTIDPTRAAKFALRVAGLNGKVKYTENLPGYDPRAGIPGYGFLHWRPPLDDKLPHLAYLFRDGPAALAKARAFTYAHPQPPEFPDPYSAELAAIPDEVLAAAWSPDGMTLVYSTERGTFLMDFNGLDHTPVKISDWVFEGLEWGG